MCKMSQTDPSSTSFKLPDDASKGGNTKKSEDDSDDKSSELKRNDPDRCLREKVLKEVGLTSTAFIGPAFPPQAIFTKPDIEDSLSMFYKELEKIDTPDQSYRISDNQEKEDVQPNLNLPELPTSKHSQDIPDGKMVSTSSFMGINSYQSNSGPTKSSWDHWYQNEPYQLKRPRPVGNQWDYPPPPNRPPDLRFHRPPFPHHSHQSGFSNTQNTPAPIQVNQNGSRMRNHHHKDFHPPPFSSRPPPNVFIPPAPPQGRHETPPQNFGWNDQSFYDTDLNDVPVRWSGERREEWQRRNDDYNRPPRFMSEIEPWEQQRDYRPYEERCEYQSDLVLILMRGLPGSGKTTLARELLSSGPSGIILSTDDYFAEKEGYHYDPGLLGAAHEWNQSRAKDAMHDGCSPIIIDNTNLQAWEMKPYVKMALDRGYKVDFYEPDTSWKFDPCELEKRNKHGVPQDKIAQMMDRFSFPISVDIVMNSHEPAHVNQRRRPEQQQQIRKKMHFC
ncbi:PREDICTED: NEDD4-binding protein 2-like 2 [Poecilia mexicana]|uniref:NEDD4 binding protein 2-like 2 n=1 Tax=Poecilia mexicana TaxID=48701 RepID=A0A3B3Y2G9_9TELE|nr:PREDICTED: NEDD4-binding protein 2-like 2 [Poecilia mexicana]